MTVKVTRDQFEVGESKVVHRPTGATFSAQGDGSIAYRNWGQIGAMASSGEDYRREEIQAVAANLLREQKQKDKKAT